MTLRMYNTLTKSKEIFKPIQPGKVSMYVCGPTVYDYIHIGNARPLIFFDVVRRYLQFSGYDVRYIVNFTDVDDKLIRKAGELQLTVPEVAERFIRAYYEDAGALGIHPADEHPRVMENIGPIIEFISGLVAKGAAYESGGDVYFRTASYADYGKLSQQNMDQLQFGIRIEVDERKESPQDFVLWKQAKPGEICWPSPWGEGRPGWHIECSTMARKYLAETIDIHGGGQDLQFPHHECEAAQSAALTGKPLAHYWLHNGYIHVDNQKMSKSLGNGINVRELLQSVSPQVLRFFLLSTHYRNPLNFSEETISQAQNSLDRINHSLLNVKYRLKTASGGELDHDVAESIEKTRNHFTERMNDDFNTADAITVIFEWVSEVNHYLQLDRVAKPALEAILRQFAEMNQVLGLWKEDQAEALDEEIERLIADRTAARKAKDWARADEIRDQLSAMNIILEDTPQGIRWRRK